MFAISVHGVAAFAMGIAAAALYAQDARADFTATESCTGRWSMQNCVQNWRDDPRDPHIRHVRGPANADEMREAQARDRKWLAYCRPLIVKDRYGVGRYVYARSGCEFGRSED